MACYASTDKRLDECKVVIEPLERNRTVITGPIVETDVSRVYVRTFKAENIKLQLKVHLN